MLPNLPPKKRIENRLSQEVGAVSPPLYLHPLCIYTPLYLHPLHQDPVFPAAPLSDTDAMSDSSTASNISADTDKLDSPAQGKA